MFTFYTYNLFTDENLFSVCVSATQKCYLSNPQVVCVCVDI